MTKIKNLHKYARSGYFWYAKPNVVRRCYTPFLNENGDCYYSTNEAGEGIFYLTKDGRWNQIVGTCQFQACKTASGTRRKLNKLFDEGGW